MKLKDYPFICPEPFVNVENTTKGVYKPCCVVHNWNPRKNKNISQYHTIENSSFKQFYDSPEMKRLRNAMKQNNDKEFINDICKVCIQQEQSGNRSHRQFYIDRFTQGDFKDYKTRLENIIENNTPPDFYASVEMDGLGGNGCNLSCSMCSASLSSTYQKEAIALKELPQEQRVLKLKPNAMVLKELPDILNKTLELKLVGGEPLLAKETYQLMKMIRKPENTVCRIITNATRDPQQFIELASKFKKCIVNVSLEGYKELNNYIRYPSNWDIIQNNIKKLQTLRNGELTIVCTINVLNVGHLTKLFDKTNYRVTFSSLVTDNVYSLNSLHPKLKEMYLNQYYSQVRKYQGQQRQEVIKLIKYLENSTFNPDDHQAFLQSVQRRDQHRKTNLQHILKEYSQIL
jgi:wyosine [tRNA(Phe)-imidazoG37] synthetase (radical SAM superfamily)